MEQWEKFLQIFTSRNIKIFTLLLSLASVVVVFIANVYTTLQTTTLEETRILYVKEWIYLQYDYGLTVNVLFYVAFIIAAAGGILFFKVREDLKEVEKEKSGPQNMRKLLITTTSLMGLSLINEAGYLLLKSDFVVTFEVIFQLYITYNTMVLVIFIVITLSIFMEQDMIKYPKISLILIVFLNLIVIAGYLIMMIYGLNPVGYETLIAVPVVLVALVAIGALFVVFRIFSLIRKVKDEEGALFSISIIVLLLVFSIVCLIICGLTVKTAHTVNMIFRTLRVSTFLIIAVLYYPAFIRPAKKNK